MPRRIEKHERLVMGRALESFALDLHGKASALLLFVLLAASTRPVLARCRVMSYSSLLVPNAHHLFWYTLHLPSLAMHIIEPLLFLNRTPASSLANHSRRDFCTAADKLYRRPAQSPSFRLTSVSRNPPRRLRRCRALNQATPPRHDVRTAGQDVRKPELTPGRSPCFVRDFVIDLTQPSVLTLKALPNTPPAPSRTSPRV